MATAKCDICNLTSVWIVSIYVVSFIMLWEFNSLYLVLLILFPGNNKNPYNSFNSLLICFLSWYFINDVRNVSLIEESTSPFHGHWKPYYQRLRAKGEVIIMMSERLGERKKATVIVWPLRKLLPSWSPTPGVPREYRIMLLVFFTIL